MMIDLFIHIFYILLEIKKGKKSQKVTLKVKHFLQSVTQSVTS